MIILILPDVLFWFADHLTNKFVYHDEISKNFRYFMNYSTFYITDKKKDYVKENQKKGIYGV